MRPEQLLTLSDAPDETLLSQVERGERARCRSGFTLRSLSAGFPLQHRALCGECRQLLTPSRDLPLKVQCGLLILGSRLLVGA